jgi:anti-anti-sigma regulatory factor
MLKISIRHDTPSKGLLVEVEGRLAGPWVDEFERSWETECGKTHSQPITVRLTNVTFIDDAGKQLLGKIFRSGARVEGNGCMVRAIIAAITGASLPDDCRGEIKTGVAVESRGGQGESDEHTGSHFEDKHHNQHSGHPPHN